MNLHQVRNDIVAASLTLLMFGANVQSEDQVAIQTTKNDIETAARANHGTIIYSRAADTNEWNEAAIKAVQAKVRDPGKINGEVPAGKWGHSTTELLSERVDENGVAYRVFLTKRPAGYRTPIHVHPYGGMDCVVGGEVLYMYEGMENKTIKPTGCMPLIPYRKMSAMAVTDMEIITYFTLPKDAPEWIVVQPDAITGDQDRWEDAIH